jgi:phage tail-like protein
VPETANRKDPFPAFRFEITLDQESVGGFSECTGLQQEIEVQDYPEGGMNQFLLKFPGRVKQTNLQLKRGIVDRMMWDWYYDLTQGRMKTRGGSILVRDPSGKDIVMEWHFRNAFPCKWVGPDLNATQNNVAVETFELCIQGMTRVK